MYSASRDRPCDSAASCFEYSTVCGDEELVLRHSTTRCVLIGACAVLFCSVCKQSLKHARDTTCLPATTSYEWDKVRSRLLIDAITYSEHWSIDGVRNAVTCYYKYTSKSDKENANDVSLSNADLVHRCALENQLAVTDSNIDYTRWQSTAQPDI